MERSLYMRYTSWPLLTGILVAALATASQASKHYDILMAGYYDGPSVSGTVGFDDIFEKVPLGLEIELGYSWTRTGDPILASQVFINQNQVGQNDTQSSGGVLDLGLNGTYPLGQKFGPCSFKLFGGPRFARWDVRHEYTN